MSRGKLRIGGRPDTRWNRRHDTEAASSVSTLDGTALGCRWNSQDDWLAGPSAFRTTRRASDL
jgi:hypothetical protein